MKCHYCGQPLAKPDGYSRESVRLAHAEAVFRTQERLLRMGAIK